MIYGTCVFLYALHHHAKPPKQRSVLYIAAMLLCSILVTIIYLVWKNPIFHQASYAMLVFLLLYEAIIALRSFPEIKATVLYSLCFYILGFCLWNVDNVFCSSLRSIRNKPSSSPILHVGSQLHAWWHIFTGYATYLHIVFSSYARSLYLKKSCEIKLMDELPMIYGSCIYIYTVKTSDSAANSKNFKWLLGTVTYSFVSTFVYVTLTNPLMFQCFYGVIACAAVYETVCVGLKQPNFRFMTALSVLLYAVGFALWNTDIHFCSRIRSIRSSSKTGFDFANAATQLHAWWHLFAGAATYLQLQITILVRCSNLNIPCCIEKFGGFPYVMWNQQNDLKFD